MAEYDALVLALHSVPFPRPSCMKHLAAASQSASHSQPVSVRPQHPSLALHCPFRPPPYLSLHFPFLSLDVPSVSLSLCIYITLSLRLSLLLSLSLSVCVCVYVSISLFLSLSLSLCVYLYSLSDGIQIIRRRYACDMPAEARLMKPVLGYLVI
jgi:hypothetical protein